MAGIVEKSYGKVLKATFRTINPSKRLVVKTECRVHKAINRQSLVILKNDGLIDPYNFFSKYITQLNLGTVWADQDLKSSNHFYNPEKKRGLYGNSNALKDASAYYTMALTFWYRKDINESIFCLGAVCHLVQDMTVPQHVSIKLLKKHRKYEQWVKRAYELYDSFKCYDGGIYLKNVGDFIELNANAAIKVYEKNKDVTVLEDRFYNISDEMLCQAQRTTAGVLNMFYSYVCKMGGDKC